MSKMEFYLKIDPDGTLSWIPLCRKPHYDSIYCGAEAISVQDLYSVIGCSCVEQVHTRIRGVVIMVDESGKIKDPPQPVNPLASKLYLGAPYGDMIHGPAVVFSLRPMPPLGEQDLFPLTRNELNLLSVCLGVRIPEVIE